MIRTGCREGSITLTKGADQQRVSAVFRHDGKDLRLDGLNAPNLAEVAAALPVEYISGEAQLLVLGAPRDRRRFLDWALFHVEPCFLNVWRCWHRAHRQRNALLRNASFGEMEFWTAAVAEWGEALTQLRSDFVKKIDDLLRENSWIFHHTKDITIQFRQGWGDGKLHESLWRSADRERQAKRAIVGPQYDDWEVKVAGQPARLLSRGQVKLAVFFLMRVRAESMRQAGRPPILLVDDFTADLDAQGVETAIRLLGGLGAQVWLSVLEEDKKSPLPRDADRFHVEPGVLRHLAPKQD